MAKAKIPRKNDIGWKHTVTPPRVNSSDTLWAVWGPSIERGAVFCSSEGDADSVAAALNLALNYNAAKRQAADLANTLAFFAEFN